MPRGDAPGFGAKELQAELKSILEWLDEPDIKHVVIDLSASNYYGSQIIGAINSMVLKARDTGGRSAVCEVSNDMREGINVMNLDRLWTFYDTSKEALAEIATESTGQKAAAAMRGRTAKLAIAAGVVVLAVVVVVIVNIVNRPTSRQISKSAYSTFVGINDELKAKQRESISEARWKLFANRSSDKVRNQLERLEESGDIDDPLNSTLIKAGRDCLLPILKTPREPPADLPASRPWIIASWPDLLLIVGTPLLLIPLLFVAVAQENLAAVVIVLGSFGAIGHHVPGLMRAYLDRDLFARFRMRFLLAPVFLLAVSLYFNLRGLTGLGVILFVWGTWHFLMQTYGFSRIYDAKVKSFAATTIWLDFLLCFFWFIACDLHSAGRMESLLVAYYECGGPLLPEGSVAALRSGWAIATGVVTVAYLANVVRRWMHGDAISIVKLLLLTLTIGCWWFSIVSVTNVVLGLALFEIFHDIQYLTIVWAFNRGRVERGAQVGTLTSFLFRRSGIMIGLYVGIVAAYGYFGFVGDRSKQETHQLLFAFLAASSLLHFYYDGFIWKVREKSTRESLNLDGGSDEAAGTFRLPGWSLHGLKWCAFIIPAAWLAWSQSGHLESLKDANTRIAAMRSVVSHIPDSPHSLTELGVLLRETGRLDEAEKSLRHSIALDPKKYEPHYNLGLVLMDRKNFTAAIDAFHESARLSENHADSHINLGLCLIKTGRPRDAVAPVERAVAVGAANAAGRIRLKNTIELLAWTLATSADPQSQWPEKSLELARLAVERSAPNNPQTLDTLAAAYAANRQFPAAWDDVIDDGEFRYIPDNYPSRQGEALFQSAFTSDLYGSSIAIVVRRESPEHGLQEQDYEFVRRVLKPRLEQIDKDELAEYRKTVDRDAESVVTQILTPDDTGVGELLVSDDKQAMLLVIGLRTEFQERRNEGIVRRVEELIAKNGELHNRKKKDQHIPAGLDLTFSGSAAVGRDMRVAAEESADATHVATLLLVVGLLLIIYRAPFLVLIPVLTVGISVQLALCLLAMLARAGYVELFTSIDIYVKVVMYGAGVDYCMFLMARYKEELDAGASFDEAISAAVRNVGSALAASAGTTMAGIGMMVFAEFGKFKQAGTAMSFSLFFVLLASLTFAPAMLRLAGRWAFWPRMKSEQIPSTGGWVSPTSLISRLMQSNPFRGLWEKIGEKLQAKPGTIWLACLALMAPFACVGVLYYNYLSFGLLSELPPDDPSVIGTKAVQDHFPAGATGPVTVLVKNPKVDFSDKAGIQAIEQLTNRLNAKSEELHIADVRSISHPFGVSLDAETVKERMHEKAHDKAIEEEREKRRLKPNEGLSIPVRARIRQKVREAFEREYRERTNATYLSDKGELTNHVTRLDIVFQDDPFSRVMIARFDQAKETIRELLPAEIAEGSELYFIGSTPSIRDLKTVTGRDQIRIDVLVIVGVLVVLFVLLRRFAISAYLILSVFFSYLVTLGFTFAVFWALDPAGFAGLDWKVPIFLFTILIAVGEDYNIYLMTRIGEEQSEHGAVKGVTVALTRTGSIISSCGFIMAGTFSSLMVGSLAGMQQLGFALAFGVLLDTFVVRPILVPAYLILLYQGRFGAIGRFLGAESLLPSENRPAANDTEPGTEQQWPATAGKAKIAQSTKDESA
eukprot:g8352.t1